MITSSERTDPLQVADVQRVIAWHGLYTPSRHDSRRHEVAVLRLWLLVDPAAGPRAGMGDGGVLFLVSALFASHSLRVRRERRHLLLGLHVVEVLSSGG